VLKRFDFAHSGIPASCLRESQLICTNYFPHQMQFELYTWRYATQDANTDKNQSIFRCEASVQTMTSVTPSRLGALWNSSSASEP